MPPASRAPDLMRSLAPGSSWASATSPNGRNSKAPHCETPSVSCNRRRRWCPAPCAGIRAGAPASITLTICRSSGEETSPSRSSADRRQQPSAWCVSCVRSASRRPGGGNFMKLPRTGKRGAPVPPGVFKPVLNVERHSGGGTHPTHFTGQFFFSEHNGDWRLGVVAGCCRARRQKK